MNLSMTNLGKIQSAIDSGKKVGNQGQHSIKSVMHFKITNVFSYDLCNFILKVLKYF